MEPVAVDVGADNCHVQGAGKKERWATKGWSSERSGGTTLPVGDAEGDAEVHVVGEKVIRLVQG